MALVLGPAGGASKGVSVSDTPTWSALCVPCQKTWSCAAVRVCVPMIASSGHRTKSMRVCVRPEETLDLCVYSLVSPLASLHRSTRRRAVCMLIMEDHPPLSYSVVVLGLRVSRSTSWTMLKSPPIIVPMGKVCCSLEHRAALSGPVWLMCTLANEYRLVPMEKVMCWHSSS